MTKKSTKKLTRSEGPISDMDYHVVGTVPLGTPLGEIHPNPPYIKPQPETTQPRKPLTAKELHHIEELVALGMDISEARFVIAIERGDSIGDVVTTPEELDNALGKSHRRRSS
ncbi:MAG: hypothetical protein M3R06_00710 [Chloroflexota bacterium]|nr:hypothetical protein [Chloroflexota bacterium]